jgi:hypothetical protein
VIEPSRRQRIILDDVRAANFRGRRLRLYANRDRNALRAAGLIVGSPPNAPGITSRGGQGMGWSITEKGLAILEKYGTGSGSPCSDDHRRHEVGEIEEVA